MLPEGYEVKVAEYHYSDPIKIKEYPGGFISVQVGYVDKHPERNQIYLLKEWKGQSGNTLREKFNIKNSQDWVGIKGAVEKLWPEIGQALSTEDIQRSVGKISEEKDLLELVARYPELIKKIPSDINILNLSDEHKLALKKLLTVGHDLSAAVLNRVAEQPVRDLEEFVKLLEEMKLSTINSLASHVNERLTFINIFESIIHKNESYERAGPGSVHSLLKANTWIVDRSFSVLHDDKTLKTIIANQWGKDIKDIDGAGQRPDFLCMSDPLSEKRGSKRLIIIEIKRPSVLLKFAHIEQVGNYREVLERYSGKNIEDFSCYLIGREIDSKITDSNFSSLGIKLKTYTDFIAEAREFYREYLELIKDEDLAV